MIKSGAVEILKKKKIFYFLVPIFILAIYNFSIITIGYYKNNRVNEETHKMLNEASDK